MRNTSPPMSHKRVPDPTTSTNQKTRKAVSFIDTAKDNVSVRSTGDDDTLGKMGIVEVKDDPASLTNQKTRKTVSSFDTTKDNVSVGSTGDDDTRGKMGILEVKDDPGASCRGTPLTTMTLLESKMKKRKRSGAKKTVVAENVAEKSVNASNRRRRKSWSSLKEIAESNDNGNNLRLMDLTVPFSIGI